jgi:hypothetical protein
MAVRKGAEGDVPIILLGLGHCGGLSIQAKAFEETGLWVSSKRMASGRRRADMTVGREDYGE